MNVDFVATTYEHRTNLRVDVPEDVSRAFNDRGYIPVHGTLNGVGVRGTFAPVGGGRHVFYINKPMRQRAGVNAGDTVALSLDRDVEVRRPPMVHELAAALEADPVAKAAWQAETPGRRKRVLMLLSWMRNPEALRRRVEKLVRNLHGSAA